MMPLSVKKMKSDQRKKKSKYAIRRHAYHCTACGYGSNRRFNVERHSIRIHSNCIAKKCCGILFLKKSDLYQHVEDCHPFMRSTCLVSKHKYKIIGRGKKLSTDSRKENEILHTVNNFNISSECEVKRRSMRIQKQTESKEKATLNKISTESESAEYDSNNDSIVTNHDVDYDRFEKLTHSLDNNDQMNTSILTSAENKNRYGNIKTIAQLPLKKRILCDINNNILRQTNHKKITAKVAFSDKENQNPVDIFLNKYQSTTIVNQILTVEQSLQIWNDITQRQRDYLRFIDFGSF